MAQEHPHSTTWMPLPAGRDPLEETARHLPSCPHSTAALTAEPPHLLCRKFPGERQVQKSSSILPSPPPHLSCHQKQHSARLHLCGWFLALLWSNLSRGQLCHADTPQGWGLWIAPSTQIHGCLSNHPGQSLRLQHEPFRGQERQEKSA